MGGIQVDRGRGGRVVKRECKGKERDGAIEDGAARRTLAEEWAVHGEHVRGGCNRVSPSESLEQDRIRNTSAESRGRVSAYIRIYILPVPRRTSRPLSSSFPPARI